MSMFQARSFPPRWMLGLALALLTYGMAFWLRMLEWPSWQEVEFHLGSEMLLATHDAYHWVAGADGFEFGTGHPMSELLRLLALAVGSEPAHVAFWLPPVVASLVALLVFAWAWSMGSMEAGVCAGVLASLAPGFLARTLLGYSDTDLVTLFLPLVVGFAPAVWAMRFMHQPLALLFIWSKHAPPPGLAAPRHSTRRLLSPLWIILLALSGLIGWWAQEWHSLFPYLARYNAGLLAFMALVLPQSGERRPALLAALIFALPTLMGYWGLLLGGICLVARLGATLRLAPAVKLRDFLLHPLFLVPLCIFGLTQLVDTSIIQTMLNHMQGYLKRGGDVARHAADVPLIYPSVAQSIIEVQDLSLQEILLYFHPWTPVALLGLAGFLVVLGARSGALFLLPLLVLALLSTRLGGRMVMFGAPVIALGLTLPVDWLACALGDVRAKKLRRYAACALAFTAVALALMPDYAVRVWAFWTDLGLLRAVALICVALMLLIGIGRLRGWRSAVRIDFIGPHLVYRAAAVTLMLITVIPPLADLIPAMTHGPILNRRHADALRSMRTSTPEDAMIWLWWDWGYATHHFARRSTIADGAAHGGPSLYLPAAVFATDDPRFARQLIKYTAARENVPGYVFAGMSAPSAAALIAKLKDPKIPLIDPPGKQYLVVSFDMLNLGFWISSFGTWDFATSSGRGYAISIVPQQLSYRLDTGEVLMQGSSTAVPAASIDLFEDGRLIHKDYLIPPDNLTEQAQKSWLSAVESRRNVHFLFNRVTGEKLVVDDKMYNTLMIQLLVSKPSDPRLSPYFRLIFDNVFCRIYEVR